jgi:hypothetical protein
MSLDYFRPLFTNTAIIVGSRAIIGPLEPGALYRRREPKPATHHLDEWRSISSQTKEIDSGRFLRSVFEPSIIMA